MYPALRGRSERFPGGESLDDLAVRAEKAIDEVLVPYVWDEAGEDAHVAVVSHGLFLSELIAALVKRVNFTGTSKSVLPREFRGMKNTGWTKVLVTVKVGRHLGVGVPPSPVTEKSTREHNSRVGADKSALLDVKVTNVNNCDHLLLLVRICTLSND